jgi:hypothetical protein
MAKRAMENRRKAAMNDMRPGTMITVREAAAALGVSPEAVKRKMLPTTEVAGMITDLEAAEMVLKSARHQHVDNPVRDAGGGLMTPAVAAYSFGGLPGPGLSGIAVRQEKEIFPYGHTAFLGFCLDQFPFLIKILNSAAGALGSIGNRAARAFTPAAPGPFIRHYCAVRCISRIITLASKQTTAIVRHFILKASKRSLVILQSFLNRTKVNRRRLLSAASCYLIVVSINTIKVPIAASASSRLDIAVIHSVAGMRWLFFCLLLATHCYVLSISLNYSVPLYSRYVKSFFSKNLQKISFFRRQP